MYKLFTSVTSNGDSICELVDSKGVLFEEVLTFFHVP